MKDFTTIELTIDQQISTIWFNRPEVHNAFNEVMISELQAAIDRVKEMNPARILLFRGRGKSFCAGADLNWMKKMAGYTYEQNLDDSRKLARLIYSIYTFPLPTIAVVHGASIGGGNGIVSACDYVIADEEAVFSLSEVKIGLVPSVIGPYVIKRIGEFRARELMLSGKRINGQEAYAIGLVNRVVNGEKMEEAVNEIVQYFLTGGPEAIRICKKLIVDVVNHLTMEEALEYTARIIAEVRASAEGQEGIRSFLEKRKPSWIRSDMK